MEMQRINSGKLRAIGYDRRERTLRIEFDDGSLKDYLNVGEEIWRRLSGASSAWSFFRDNVEEEFACRKAAGAKAGVGRNPLDDLFK
ncbi:MAG: KTSC domain-containing protein [Rhodocyclaceae bacterium]|nr:KTSC domain-containing protein [Rhodocyclaceae bacterium]MBX3669108.1 KTSC domain-containing protein [Rhodocyclaceae bacterium]